MKVEGFKTIRVVHAVILCALALSCPASAQELPGNHRASVRDLIVRLGLADEARHALDTRIYALRDARPEVHGEFWVEFMASVRSDRLLDSLTVYFVERISEADVDRLAALAASPEGLEALRAWTAALPGAVELRAGWEAEIGERIAAELIKSGYDPP
jgi:hypothetical protein